MARRSPTSSPSLGAASEPTAAARPVTKMTTPPTSSVSAGGMPSGGSTWGRIAVRKNTWLEPARTSRHTVATSSSEVRPGRPSAAVFPVRGAPRAPR